MFVWTLPLQCRGKLLSIYRICNNGRKTGLTWFRSITISEFRIYEFEYHPLSLSFAFLMYVFPLLRCSRISLYIRFYLNYVIFIVHIWAKIWKEIRIIFLKDAVDVEWKPFFENYPLRQMQPLIVHDKNIRCTIFHFYLVQFRKTLYPTI